MVHNLFCLVVLGNVLNKTYIKKILTHYELITAVFYSPKRPQMDLETWAVIGLVKTYKHIYPNFM